MEALLLSSYFAPLVPLITRSILCMRWRRLMSTDIPEAAQERDVHRGFILSLAGFSFTAVAGLAVLDSPTRVSLQLPTWYVLASFVSLLSSLNLQSYKVTRWQNQMATALLEVGTLSLMLAVVALLFTASFGRVFQLSAGTITLSLWFIDHLVRLSLDSRYLSELHSKTIKVKP